MSNQQTNGKVILTLGKGDISYSVKKISEKRNIKITFDKPINSVEDFIFEPSEVVPPKPEDFEDEIGGIYDPNAPSALPYFLFSRVYGYETTDRGDIEITITITTLSATYNEVNVPIKVWTSSTVPTPGKYGSANIYNVNFVDGVGILIITIKRVLIPLWINKQYISVVAPEPSNKTITIVVYKTDDAYPTPLQYTNTLAKLNIIGNYR